MKTEITLELANKMIEGMKEYAVYRGAKVVMAVASKEGHPISVQAMDDAFIVSYDLAVRKAFTAVAFKMPTEALGKLTGVGGEFEGLEKMMDIKIITLGGGYPVTSHGQVIGAIGVSGGSDEDDRLIAEYGARFIEGV